MSTAVKQFHEEEAIGKTYDFQVARRLLRYLKPYGRLLVPALVLTLLVGGLVFNFGMVKELWRILVPALRVSGSQSRDFLLPRVGVRADVGHGVTLLGNASESARMPNLTELFGNSGFVRGDPTLRPETADTWDLGFRWQSPWTSRVVTAATLEYAHFESDVEDLIALVPSSVNVFKPTNIGGATIRGHEVAVRLAFLDRLLLTTNYTHQDTRDASDEPFFQGLQLPGRPADEASVRVELGWSRTRPLPALAVAWVRW